MGNEYSVGPPRAPAELFARRRWLRPLVGLGVVAVVAAACGGASRSVGTASTDHLVIGQIGPGLGPLAWMGRPQEVGARLAIQDINSEGGVLGKPITLNAANDTTADHAAATGNQLLNSMVDAVIGAPSGGADSFDQLMARNGVVQCLPSRSALLYSSVPTDATTFTTAPPDSAAAPAIVSELETQKSTSVAIAAPNDAEGKNVAAAVTASLTKSHIPTKTITYAPNSNSFDSVATQVLASKPKAVVELGGAEGAALTGALIKAGASPMALVAGPNMLVPTLAQDVNPAKVSAVNGMYVAGPGGDAAFDSRVGQTTANSLLDAAQSYDCAVIIALAAEEAKSTDPSAFASHIADVTTGSHQCTTYALCLAILRQGRSIAYVGHAGPLRLNSQNQPTSAREILAYFNNGYLGQADFHDFPISGSS